MAIPIEIEVLIPALASLPMAVMITDREGFIRWANSYFYRLTTYAAEEIAGRHVEMLEPEKTAQSRHGILQQMAAAGEPWRGEAVWRYRNGELHSFEQTIAPIRDATGKTSHLLWAHLDLQGRGTDRTRTEDELRESRDVLQTILNSLPVRVFWKDRNLVYLGCNTPFARDAGFENPEDIIGKDDRATTWREQAERYRADDRAVIESGVARLLFEEPQTTPSGERIHLLTSKLPLRNAGGAITGVLGAYYEITDRKRAEDALRESEEWHRTVLQTAMDGFWLADSQGRLLEANAAYCRMSGYSAAELRGMSIAALEANETLGGAAAHMRQILARGEERFESRHRRKDGSVFDVEISVRYVEREGGRFVAFLRDITERKRAEASLRDSEKLLRDSQKVAGLGSYILDVPRGVWRSSAVLDEIFGIDETFIRSVSGWSSLLHPECREEMSDYLTNWVLGEHNRFDKEYRIVRCNDGQVRWLHGLGELEFDGEGQPIKFTGTILDITERKRAEEEKAKLEAQLQHAQKMESIGRLAGGVAHDFNNLLTVINGYSKMLLSQLSDEDPTRAKIAEIHAAGERAAGLTHHLLAYSRKQVLQPRVLDLNHVVGEMRSMLARLVGEDVELRFELHGGSVMVHADPHQLGQVIMNLVVNAKDAMPYGGAMLVETATVELDERTAQAHPGAPAGRYVTLAVNDSGVGMDDETRRRIFEPFFTTKEVGKGTGLGLSMIEGIVTQSGGYVEVASQPGHGSTFKIFLPLLEGSVEGAATMEPALPGGGNETVLVVEDQTEVRQYTAAVLEAYGYRVILAENAGAALMLFERERGIDLVLTDVVMPNVSGCELANRLEKLRPGIKILFMSGYADDMTGQYRSLGDDAKLIQKPFSPEELAGKIRDVLGPRAQAARIVVADDEAGVRGFLRKVLEGGGYEVIEAEDGRQALRQARSARIDLVITDLVMPEQEGLETIQALRRDMPGIGIIAISGALGGRYLKTARLLGADAVLNKPVSAAALLASVAGVLKTRQ